MAYDFTLFDQKLAASKEWLAKEYRGLRTGRASPTILDGIQVTAYGSSVPLKQIGTVGIEDPRTLRVTAWDAGLLKDIERAITQANLGLGTVADSSGVRVTFPELTSERREQLVKVAKGRLEEARSAVRVTRDECWKDIQAKEEEGGMSEDDKFRLKDELQKKIDETNAALERAFESKELEMSS